MKIFALISSILLLSMPLALYAYDSPSEQVFTQVGSSTLDRSVNPVSSAFELNASKDNSTASIKLGRSVSDSQGSDSMFSTWSVTASAPFNKSSETTELANLNGLANAFTLGIAYTKYAVGGKRTPQLESGRAAALYDEICAEMRNKYRVSKGVNEVEAGKLDCDTNQVLENVPDRYLEFNSLFWDPGGRRIIWGVEGKIGQANFEYIDTTTLDKSKDSKSPWSLKGFVGLIPENSKMLATLGLEYQKAYKASEIHTICPAGGGTVICQTGSLEPPDENTKYLSFIEVRRTIGGAGVSFKVTHDFKNDVTGVDVPVYLIRDTKGILNAGVRAGWRDDTSDLELGVFVGSSFSIF